MTIPQFYIDSIIWQALKEDMNYIDAATDYLIPKDQNGSAYFIAKDEGILCGIDVAFRVFSLLDETFRVKPYKKDGDWIKVGDILADFEGKAAMLLKGESIALNLMQHLSGIATATAEAVGVVAGTKASVVDSLKTIPGIRMLQKYAVLCGGGKNSRINLSDGAILRRNHIFAAGGISSAIAILREELGHMTKIEVEAETISEVREAISAGVDIILLNKMDYRTMAEAVRVINGKAIAEAAGATESSDLRKVAETGVDIVSVGGLTQSVKAFEIRMRMGVVTRKSFFGGSKASVRKVRF